jgi:hypothetical protein
MAHPMHSSVWMRFSSLAARCSGSNPLLGTSVLTCRQLLTDLRRQKYSLSSWKVVVFRDGVLRETTPCRSVQGAIDYGDAENSGDSQSAVTVPEVDVSSGLQVSTHDAAEQRRGGRRRGRGRTLQPRVSSSESRLEEIPDFVVISGPGETSSSGGGLREQDGATDKVTLTAAPPVQPQPGWSELWDERNFADYDVSEGTEEELEGEEEEEDAVHLSSPLQYQSRTPFDDLGVDDRVTVSVTIIKSNPIPLLLQESSRQTGLLQTVLILNTHSIT